jgi:probable rRNA maturation factor
VTPTVEVADLRGDDAEPLDLEAVRGAAAAALAAEGRGDAHLSVTVVDDARMAELHERYMGIEGPTDVLSFPLDDGTPGPVPLLGEVVVSEDTATREARERGLTPRYELLLYVVHGTLHLLGYDDHAAKDRERMHTRQAEILEGYLAERGG